MGSSFDHCFRIGSASSAHPVGQAGLPCLPAALPAALAWPRAAATRAQWSRPQAEVAAAPRSGLEMWYQWVPAGAEKAYRAEFAVPPIVLAAAGLGSSRRGCLCAPGAPCAPTREEGKACAYVVHLPARNCFCDGSQASSLATA